MPQPPPFARVWVVYDEPLEVPPGADPAAVMERLGAALAAAEDEARRYAAGEEPAATVRVPA